MLELKILTNKSRLYKSRLEYIIRNVFRSIRKVPGKYQESTRKVPGKYQEKNQTKSTNSKTKNVFEEKNSMKNINYFLFIKLSFLIEKGVGLTLIKQLDMFEKRLKCWQPLVQIT